MLEREERLLGFQIIRKINLGNDGTFSSAAQLCLESPSTLDPLDVTLEEVKEMVECNCKIIDLEINTMLSKFLEGFNDRLMLNRALRRFEVRRDHVERDRDEVLQHTPNVRNVNALVNTLAELRPHGELLKLYKEWVELVVNPTDHIPREEGVVTATQNLLNAMAYELKGICNYTGELRYKTVEDRKRIVNGRLAPAWDLIKKCPDTRETREFSKVINMVTEGLIEAKTKADLNTLSDHINYNVKQLPILWRWWSYGT